jgi:uncharacterized Zn-binding protein involved in type VI secretion
MYMKQVVRLFDVNEAAGFLLQGHANITVNNRPLGKYMSVVSPDLNCPFPPIHCAPIAAFPGSKKVMANNTPVLRVGDRDSCGDARETGSENVLCG